MSSRACSARSRPGPVCSRAANRSGSCWSGGWTTQRDRCVLARLSPHEPEGVTYDGGTGVACRSRPELHVVAPCGVSPVVECNLIAVVISKQDRKRGGGIRIGKREGVPRPIDFRHRAPTRLPTLDIRRLRRHSGNDPGLVQKSHDALDGRLLVRRRHAKPRLPAVAPVECRRGCAQQDVRRLEDAKASEHLTRVEQIHGNARLSHPGLPGDASTILWTRSDRPHEESPPATPVPRDRTASAGGRNAAPHPPPWPRARREDRPRSPPG